jgi:hypothetical protein
MTREEFTDLANTIIIALKEYQEEQIERAVSNEIPHRIHRYIGEQLSDEIRVLVAKAVREQVDVRITVKQAASGPVGTDIASDQSGGK